MKLRFAPSPTGYLHVGNTRTLLVNWLWARRHQATFYLRFDDTDQERSDQKYVHQIIADLAWLGIKYEAVFHQSERLELYTAAAQTLRDKGRLYPCYETRQELDFKRKRLLSQGHPPIYDRAALKLTSDEIAAFEREGRKPHWRFKLAPGEIQWDDLAHGPLSFHADHLSDPIVVREDGTPVFTLSGMVDDLDMGITHIIRGDDHITNTAIQIQILEALGGTASAFNFGHIPLLTGAQGEGLSKRDGSLSLKDLKEDGIEAAALVNYLAHLGTSEEMTFYKDMDTLAQHFELKRLGKASPKFIHEDLLRANAHILHETSFDEVQARLIDMQYDHVTEAFWSVVKSNLTSLDDIKPFYNICFGQVTPVIEDKDFIQVALACMPAEPWSADTWDQWTQALKEKTGRKGKELFMPLRLALTGEPQGPEMKKFLPFIGHKKAVERLTYTKS